MIYPYLVHYVAIDETGVTPMVIRVKAPNERVAAWLASRQLALRLSENGELPQTGWQLSKVEKAVETGGSDAK